MSRDWCHFYFILNMWYCIIHKIFHLIVFAYVRYKQSIDFFLYNWSERGSDVGSPFELKLIHPGLCVLLSVSWLWTHQSVHRAENWWELIDHQCLATFFWPFPIIFNFIHGNRKRLHNNYAFFLLLFSAKKNLAYCNRGWIRTKRWQILIGRMWTQ